ncbi:hypothetical protein EMCRGX_G020454 [Ephydatia muelleri]
MLVTRYNNDAVCCFVSCRNGSGSKVFKRLAYTEPKTVVQAIPVESAESVVRPVGWSSERIGRAFLAGGSLFGIGSLCYYGLGLSGETGALDKARFWPSYVKDRIQSTYTYFASGLAITAVSAYGASRSSSFIRFMANRPILAMVTCFAATIGSSLLVIATPYTPETLPLKIGAFTLFSAVMGATLAPVILMAGPVVGRAAMYTAAVVGGLSLTAACAPSEKYLYMAGPLSVGLGVVLVASLGGMFATPGTALFSGLQTVVVYGGLVLFGAFMLFDTQKIIYHAENRTSFDPANMSLGIYMDTINIFIRILTILTNSNSRKK